MSTIILDSETSLAQDYARLGVVHIPSLLSPEEVAGIRAAFMEQVGSDRSAGYEDGIPEGDVLAKYPRFVHPTAAPIWISVNSRDA
jgi:phytanoyl-CoA hydroxylase